MSVDLDKVGTVTGAGAPLESTQKTRGGGVDFGEALTEALTDAAESEKAATDSAVRFGEGDPDVGIHEVIIASEKANVALRYAVTMKNKLVEAYRDIMSTPL